MLKIDCFDQEKEETHLRWHIPSEDHPSETASWLVSHSNVAKSFSLLGEDDWKEIRRNEQEREDVIGNKDTSDTPRMLMQN